MKVKTIIGIGILTIILAFFTVKFKEKIFCPYCKHVFTIIEVQKTNRTEFKTDWLGCKHCKRVFAYNYDDELEKAYKCSYDLHGNFHSEVVTLK